MSAVDDDGQSTAAYIHPYNNEGSSSERYKAAEPPSPNMHDLLQGEVWWHRPSIRTVRCRISHESTAVRQLFCATITASIIERQRRQCEVPSSVRDETLFTLAPCGSSSGHWRWRLLILRTNAIKTLTGILPSWWQAVSTSCARRRARSL